MSSYQAITRTVIMLGTIAVGIMAWRVYGPPAEKLAPVINRSVEVVNEWLGRMPSEPAIEPLPAPTLRVAEESPPAISLPIGPPLRVDADIEPAGHSEPIPPSPLHTRLAADSVNVQIEDLLAQLKRLGAMDTSLQPWGSAGKSYRFQCRLVSAENPTIERHFDAIEADPRAAVEQVLESVRRQLGR
jgi:hypothetical protein